MGIIGYLPLFKDLFNFKYMVIKELNLFLFIVELIQREVIFCSLLLTKGKMVCYTFFKEIKGG